MTEGVTGYGDRKMLLLDLSVLLGLITAFSSAMLAAKWQQDRAWE
jgi:hypothetical protein